MSNYLNIYRLLRMYNEEGMSGLKDYVLTSHFYPEDLYTSQITEKIRGKKYEEAEEAIAKIKNTIHVS